MLTEIRLLAGLEMRQIRRDAAYWLRLIGFEPDTSRAYRVYVTLFWAFWVVVMWSFGVEQVYQASRQIGLLAESPDADAWLMLVSLAIFGLQMLHLVVVLRDPPLKLSAPDLALVAAAPISRGAIVCVHFIRAITIPLILLTATGTLAALFFGWILGVTNVGLASLIGLALSAILALLIIGGNWTIGLLKQNLKSARSGSRQRAFWLIPPVLLAGAALLPDVFLWPGRIWIEALEGQARPDDFLLLGVLLGLMGAGLGWAGQRLHMTRVMADSQIYARIQKLGFFGAILAHDLVMRIRTQARLAHKPYLRQHLPPQPRGYRALLGFSGLLLVRLSPGLILRLIGSGAALVSISTTLVVINPEALQTWILLLVVLLQFRPTDLMQAFSELMRDPFLRQFLPDNPLWLLVNAAILPFLLMSLGAIVGVILQPWLAPLVGIPLVLVLLVILALLQALERVHIRLGRLRRLAYEHGVVGVGILLILSGYVTMNAWAVLLVAMLLMTALGWLLYHSVVP